MSKIAIVSLADSNYFHLLIELIKSIKRFKQSENMRLCILDAGMTIEQVNTIKKLVHSVKKAEWDIPVSSYKIRNREWLKSQVSRPFIPNYFPEFEKYIWIDCDAWLNSWFAIEYLIKGSDNNKLAICSMSDRHTGRVLRLKWIYKSFAIVKSQNFKHSISSGFPVKDCQFLSTEPHLNVGVFALNKSSNTWKVWQKNLKTALNKGRIFGSEQIALNYSVYLENCPVDLLPYYCNWIPSQKSTYWDEEKNTFVERFTPHHEIGIVHLAGGVFVDGKDMRYDKNILIPINTLSGKTVQKSFRYTLD